MQHIETVTLGSSSSSVTFSSISQDFTDLVFYIAARSDRADSFGFIDDIKFNINSNGVGVNISGRSLFTVQNNPVSNNVNFPSITGATTVANTFANTSIYITNYKAAAAKSLSMDATAENNSSNAGLAIVAFRYNSTSAITSFAMSPDVGTNFVSGSTFSLYGITAGSDGITAVS